MVDERKVIWDREAVIDFSKSIGYIRIQSPQNAAKVKLEILQKINKLSQFP